MTGSSRRKAYALRPLTPPYIRFHIRRFMSCLGNLKHYQAVTLGARSAIRVEYPDGACVRVIAESTRPYRAIPEALAPAILILGLGRTSPVVSNMARCSMEHEKQAEADLLHESRKHRIVRILETALGFGPIRSARLVPIVIRSLTAASTDDPVGRLVPACGPNAGDRADAGGGWRGEAPCAEYAGRHRGLVQHRLLRAAALRPSSDSPSLHGRLQGEAAPPERGETRPARFESAGNLTEFALSHPRNPANRSSPRAFWSRVENSSSSSR